MTSLQMIKDHLTFYHIYVTHTQNVFLLAINKSFRNQCKLNYKILTYFINTFIQQKFYLII